MRTGASLPASDRMGMGAALCMVVTAVSRYRGAGASGKPEHRILATVALPQMKQRHRKLIGGLLLVASVVLWSVVATAIYLALPSDQPPLVLIGFFAIAGIGWTLPAMSIIRWMAKPD